jgi:hypothetical protein
MKRRKASSPPVVAANDLRTENVRLADLIETEENQIRSRFDRKTAERYESAMLAGSEFPPITVVVLNGAPVLVDGFHRVAAARAVGRRSLSAIVVDAKPEELRWLAAEANMKHGLPLRKAEAREVFRAYVRAGRCFHLSGAVKSSREMANELHGLRTHQTILDWMKKDFRKVWKQMIRSEEPRHDGGEPETVSVDERMKAEVLHHLEKAKAAMRAIKDPDTRGQMIAETEEVVEAMRKLRPWNQHQMEF